MKHFTPHDLRRTAATLARNMGVEEWKGLQVPRMPSSRASRQVPQITGVYVHSKFVGEEGPVLNAVRGAALRDIIGTGPDRLRRAA